MVSKKLNKLSLLLVIFFISIIFNLFLQSNAEAACARDTNNAIKVDAVDHSESNTTAFALTGTSTFDQDQCAEEPLFYRVKFYRLALCTADPYNDDGVAADLSSCTDIFNDSDGKLIVIEPDNEVDLLDTDFVIPVATYSHGYAVISNILDIKHYERFALASNGNAATIFGYKATSGDQTGTYCWTKEVTTTYNNDYSKTLQERTIPAQQTGTSLTSTMVCGDDAPTAATATYAYASEIIDHLGDDNVTDDSDAFRNYENYASQTGVDGQLAAQLLKADETLATTVAAGVRLGHFQTISPALKITEETISLKLAFNISTSVSVDSAVNSDDEIHAVKVGADPFGINYTSAQIVGP